MVLRNWLAGLAMAAAFPAAAQVDVASFIKKDGYGDIKISPTGEYYAATVPLADRTVLMVIRRSDKTFTSKIAGVEHSAIADFQWVNPSRLVVAMAQRFSALEQPLATGELYGINADGSGRRMLVGHGDPDGGSMTESYGVTHVYQAASLIDTLPKDERKVLIAMQTYSANPQTHVERLDVYTGRRDSVASAPVRRARFAVDGEGAVRFAQGAGNDNFSKLYYRDSGSRDWSLLNDETQTGRVEWPVGFSADGVTAYLETQQAKGPNALIALDTRTLKRAEVLHDDVVEPYSIIRNDNGEPIGAFFMNDRMHARFFDEASPEARLYRTLEKAFPNQSVHVTSRTSDGRLNLVLVYSDRNPGDFYLFDSQAKTAELVFSRSRWLDPGRMATTRAIELNARDGLALHGYLTLPPGADGKGLPMVVLPHGGPFGVYDQWGFDPEAQLLAAAGYAVLQVNFRGSGNYGRSFMLAGAREWGGTMQDDVTDATRWAVAQGIADRNRICIFGASYGAYAALMGAAKEPDLYRCAVGYVGVYDLPMKYGDDAKEAKWLRAWANDWLGDPKQLAARSPNRLADRIKVPVFLAAGGKDEIAPIKHSERMEKALKSAGVPVETLYYPTEGHGFYTEEHQREFYTRLLDFLGRHLGGAKAR